MVGGNLTESGDAFLLMVAASAPQHESMQSGLRTAQTGTRQVQEEVEKMLGEAEVSHAAVGEELVEQAGIRQRLADMHVGCAMHSEFVKTSSEQTQALRGLRGEMGLRQRAVFETMQQQKAVLRLCQTARMLEVSAQTYARECAQGKMAAVQTRAVAAMTDLTSKERLAGSSDACKKHLLEEASRYEPQRNQWMSVRMEGEDALLATRMLEGRADEGGVRAEAQKAVLEGVLVRRRALEASCAAAAAEEESVEAACVVEEALLADEEQGLVEAVAADAALAAECEAQVSGAEVEVREAETALDALEHGKEATQAEESRQRLADEEAVLRRKLLRVQHTSAMHGELHAYASTSNGMRSCQETEHQVQYLEAQLQATLESQTQRHNDEDALGAQVQLLEQEVAERAPIVAQWKQVVRDMLRTHTADVDELRMRPVSGVRAGGSAQVGSASRPRPREGDSGAGAVSEVRETRTPARNSSSRDPPRKRMLSGERAGSRAAKRQSQSRDVFSGLFSASTRRPGSGGDALSDISSLFRERPNQPQQDVAQTHKSRSRARKSNAFAGL